MTAATRNALRRQARQGFTLWEVVMVLTLLGIIAAVTLPAYTSLGMAPPTQPEDVVLRLLRDARRLAITRGSTVTVLLDPKTYRYRIDTADAAGATGALADTVLPLAVGTTLAADSARLRYIFYSSGAVLGDSVVMRSSRGQATIAVEPWGGIGYAKSR